MSSLTNLFRRCWLLGLCLGLPWVSGCITTSTWEWAVDPAIVTASALPRLELDARGNGRAQVQYENGSEVSLQFAGSDGAVRFSEAVEDTTQWSTVACLQHHELPAAEELAGLLEAAGMQLSAEPLFLALFPHERPELWRYAHAIYKWNAVERSWQEVWELPILRKDQPGRIFGAVIATPFTVAFDVVTLPIQGPLFLVLALSD